jgi:hypothetical protein
VSHLQKPRAPPVLKAIELGMIEKGVGLEKEFSDLSQPFLEDVLSPSHISGYIAYK